MRHLVGYESMVQLMFVSRVFEGYVVWDRGVPHPEIKVSKARTVDTLQMLEGLIGQRVRVTVECLEDDEHG